VVHEAWIKETPPNLNFLTNLHVKLDRVAKALRKWSRKILPHTTVVMAICREVIEQLQCAQEMRQLTKREILLIKALKSRLLGPAAVEKAEPGKSLELLGLGRGIQTQDTFSSWPT
jgi:hypothetical protein